MRIGSIPNNFENKFQIKKKSKDKFRNIGGIIKNERSIQRVQIWLFASFLHLNFPLNARFQTVDEVNKNMMRLILIEAIAI